MRDKTNYLIFFVITILVVFSCHRIFNLGFLNDEWLQLGYVRSLGLLAGYVNVLSITDIFMGKGRFLGGIINNAFLYFFDSNPLPFAIFAFVFHIINSFLVYLFIKELTQKKNIAAISAFIFCIPASAHQAISWLAASVQTIGGMTFILAAVLSGLYGIKQKKTELTLLAWIFGYIAFLFKESSFFVFPILLFLPFFTRKKSERKKNYKRLLILIPIAIVGCIKIIQFFGIGSKSFISQNEIHVLSKALFNMIFYPFVSLSQFFIPFRFMLQLSFEFSSFFYSFLARADETNQSVSVVVSDMLSIIISFLLILFALFIYIRNKKIRIYIHFCLIWYVLSFIPMAIFLPERNTSYLESRYLYFSFFPIAFIIGIYAEEAAVIFGRLFKKKVIGWIIVGLVLSMFIYKQMTFMYREIEKNIAYADNIKHVMREISDLYKTLPDKPIFLVEGDKKFYYANMSLPFQEGEGYMIALTFRDRPVMPKELLGISYLAKHESQGYQEIGNKGFGFFRDRDDLLSFIRDHPQISTNQIIGMYYYGFIGNLIDTTASVRIYIEENRQKVR